MLVILLRKTQRATNANEFITDVFSRDPDFAD